MLAGETGAPGANGGRCRRYVIKTIEVERPSMRRYRVASPIGSPLKLNIKLRA